MACNVAKYANCPSLGASSAGIEVFDALVKYEVALPKKETILAKVLEVVDPVAKKDDTPVVPTKKVEDHGRACVIGLADNKIAVCKVDPQTNTCPVRFDAKRCKIY